MGVLLQRPARPRGADRVRRLSPAFEGEMMRAFVFSIVFCSIVASGFSRTFGAEVSDLDPHIVKLVQSVSEERLAAILRKLESFGTRNTLSSQDRPDRGIGAARQWILDEMSSYGPRLHVSFDPYVVAKTGRITRDVEVRNVLAILAGKSARRIYVSGHYDSVARPGGQSTSNASGPSFRDPEADPPAPADSNAPLDNPAPGVNDDGSGTALTMELARVFA